jgi:hypothetical protein
MATKHHLEDDEAGSAYDRSSESVTLVFIFWGALRSTTPRHESVRWHRGKDYTYI